MRRETIEFNEKRAKDIEIMAPDAHWITTAFIVPIVEESLFSFIHIFSDFTFNSIYEKIFMFYIFLMSFLMKRTSVFFIHTAVLLARSYNIDSKPLIALSCLDFCRLHNPSSELKTNLLCILRYSPGYIASLIIPSLLVDDCSPIIKFSYGLTYHIFVNSMSCLATQYIKK